MICSCAVLRFLGGAVLVSLGVVSWGSIRSCVVLQCLVDVRFGNLGGVLDPLVV
jgi:hypothetical protein